MYDKDHAGDEDAAVPENTDAQMPESRLELDGSVHIRDLVIPPSVLLSAELRALQIKAANQVAAGTEFPVPARNASAAEWDEFDAWWDRRYHTEPLRDALRLYPVDIRETQMGGVRAAVVTPTAGVSQQNEHRVLINLHGGGFVYSRGLNLGLLESIPVAALGRIKVVTLDYRQAPFHSYPAASEDVETVYRQLLRDYRPDAIGMFGCSAGGTLAAQAVAWFKAAGLPRPAAVGIFNIAPMPAGDRPPWGRGWGESGMWFSGVPRNKVYKADDIFWGPVRWYMEAARADDPRAYPGASDAVLAEFPPTLFVSGTRDFAVSSVVHTHTRFLRLNVDASLYIIEGGGHGTHVFAVGTPEARDAQAYVARWFQEHLGT